MIEHVSPIGYKGAGQARQVVQKTVKRKDYTETELMSPGHSNDPLLVGGVGGCQDRKLDSGSQCSTYSLREKGIGFRAGRYRVG